MNHIDRKLLTELKNGKDYQVNLPVYTTQMLHLEYEYSMILSALHYYTLAELLIEDKDRLSQDYIELAKKLQRYIYDGLIRDSFDGAQHEQIIAGLDAIRNTIIYKMQILTAYTDILQIYEYVLNRMEAGVLDIVEDVDVDMLCGQLYQYIFKEKDNMVINSKLQMITGQLPMRMTKTKFFDTVSQAFSIYNGSDKVNFDEFVERIRGTVLLDKPEGYETEYPDIYQVIQYLSGLDYQKLTKEALLEAEEKLTQKADIIGDIVTDYLMLTDVVNSVYAAVLAIPYANVVSDALTNSQNIIREVYEALDENRELSDEITNMLVALEGVQENLLEELAAYEGIFYEIQDFTGDIAEGMMENKKLNALNYMQQLHSNSVFIDIHEQTADSGVADTEYISQVMDRFESDMSVLFAEASRPVKRAYMAAVIGQLPVIFNNTQEIQEYINYTLSSCSNDSELTAVKKLLEDIMLE